MKELDLNTNLKLVGLVPLKLQGCCGDTHFTIMEVGSGYELTSAGGSKEYFQTLKETLQQCYLNWGI